MQASTFVTELSAKLGVDIAELELADRYLAGADMRRKASGRAKVDLTTKEALRLPLAIMAARTPARVAIDLMAVERFTPLAGSVTELRGDYTAGLREYGLDDLTMMDFEKLSLIDTLTKVAQHTARPWADRSSNFFSLEVHRSGPVFLQFDCPTFEGDIQFSGALDHLQHETHALRRTETLNGKVIAWIGDITKGVTD